MDLDRTLDKLCRREKMTADPTVKTHSLPSSEILLFRGCCAFIEVLLIPVASVRCSLNSIFSILLLDEVSNTFVSSSGIEVVQMIFRLAAFRESTPRLTIA